MPTLVASAELLLLQQLSLLHHRGLAIAAYLALSCARVGGNINITDSAATSLPALAAQKNDYSAAIPALHSEIINVA